MGEAHYRLVASFNSEEELKSKMPEIESFLDEGWKAYVFWQDNRGAEREGMGLPTFPPKEVHSRREFWRVFKERFPLVYEYLGSLAGRDCDNALAGELDFPDPEAGKLVEANGNTLTIGGTVWHFADWRLLEEYLKKKFGAILCHWYSSEYE